MQQIRESIRLFAGQLSERSRIKRDDAFIQ
jgi:hypothetical protein